MTHSLTWGLHLGALGSLAAYIFTRTPGDRASCGPLARWAPFACVVLGSLLMLFDLTRHMLLDKDIAPKALHMYNEDGSLTAVGRFGMVATWIGVALLVFGTGWFLDYRGKIKRVLSRCYGAEKELPEVGVASGVQ